MRYSCINGVKDPWRNSELSFGMRFVMRERLGQINIYIKDYQVETFYPDRKHVFHEVLSI